MHFNVPDLMLDYIGIVGIMNHHIIDPVLLKVDYFRIELYDEIYLFPVRLSHIDTIMLFFHYTKKSIMEIM